MSRGGQETRSGQTWEGAPSAGSAAESSKIEAKQLLILLVLSLSLAIIVIDATIVIIALNQIRLDFGISFKDLEWITSLYALVFGSFLLTWGKLSDEFGRKRIFIAGISLFVVGSIIDGFSRDLSQMLVGRVFQGFGAAMASPSTLSILTTTFTGKPRHRFRDLGCDCRCGCSSWPCIGRILYDLCYLAVGIFHQHPHRSCSSDWSCVCDQGVPIQRSKIHHRLSWADPYHARLV